MGIVILVVQSPIRVRLLGLHGLQHARPLCPSPSPYVCPNFCYWWCHPAISFSDALFSFCPQSFPASGTFPVNWLFSSDDQNTGASTSASVIPMNIQGRFPLGLTGLISLLSKRLSGVFSSTAVGRHQFFGVLSSLGSTTTQWSCNIHYFRKNYLVLWCRIFWESEDHGNKNPHKLLQHLCIRIQRKQWIWGTSWAISGTWKLLSVVGLKGWLLWKWE